MKETEENSNTNNTSKSGSLSPLKRKSSLPIQNLRKMSYDLLTKSYISELKTIQGYLQFYIKDITNMYYLKYL